MTVARTPKPAVPVASFIPALPPMGRSVKVDVKNASGTSIQYKLSDGSNMTLTPIVASIERSLTKVAPTGDPLYQAQVGFFLKIDVPKKLKRGIRK